MGLGKTIQAVGVAELLAREQRTDALHQTVVTFRNRRQPSERKFDYF